MKRTWIILCLLALSRLPEYASVLLAGDEMCITEYMGMRVLLDGNTYFALVDAESDEDEYIILKSVMDENNEEILITIDDDDEFDKVADAFDNELMSEYDYDQE